MTELSSIEKQVKSVNKSSNRSFHQQRNLMTKVFSGQMTLCPVCQQTLTVNISENDTPSIIQCKKRCTDIEFEAS